MSNPYATFQVPKTYSELFQKGAPGNPPIQNTRNATLYSKNAMPLKGINSDNSSEFFYGRRTYIEQSNAAVTPVQNIQKKWIGGNRDGSSVIDRRRTAAIGQGSINTEGTAITNQTVDQNTVRQSLTRVRNGGGAVPPKSRHFKGTFIM